MPKSTFDPTIVALEALRAIVADHGDAFRYSISKRGRLWLTLTHWDTEKYNTSVELEPMSDAHDMIGAVAVLVLAHAGKCFKHVAHMDTWLGVEETRALVEEAMTVLRLSGVTGLASAEEAPSHPASSEQG